jgi:hypothetical protein
MTALKDSVVIALVVKRMPKKKQYRLVYVMRDKYIEEVKAALKENKTHVPTKKVNLIYRMNKRIVARLQREDAKSVVQTKMELMNYTKQRTTVEFKQHGETLKATYTGNIQQAKDYLKKARGVRNIQYAHYFTVDKELIAGMWSDFENVFKPERTFQ